MSRRDDQAWQQLVGLPRDNRYVRAAHALLAETGCTVRKWRRDLTGCAATGSPSWAIESPKPTTARAFAVFAHEVGHQVLHRGPRGNRPRWLEEVQASNYAVRQAGLLLDHEAALDVWDELAPSVAYAFGKAIRRGVRPLAFLRWTEAEAWVRELGVIEWGPDGRPREEQVA